MTTKTITHEAPGKTLEVTVGEATVLQGMKRQMLQSEALAIIQKEDGSRKVPDDPEALGLYLLKRYTWPNCIAATVGSSKALNHVELTFDRFCQLPEKFVARWEQAALELNSHWRLSGDTEEEEAEEKKEEPASGKK